MTKTMGIDLGGREGKGVYVSQLYEDDGNFRAIQLMISSTDLDEQVKRISESIEQGIDQVFIDVGYGQMLAQRLQKKYGDKVVTCYYAPNSRGKIRYNEDTWHLSVDRDSHLVELFQFLLREIGNLNMIRNENEMHSFNYAYIAYAFCLGKKGLLTA